MLRIHTSPPERELVRKVETYLHEAFGLETILEPAEVERLPYFINDRYALWRANLFARDCLLVAPRQAEDGTIDELTRHMDLVRGRAPTLLVILVLPSLTPARRRALLKRRIAFLVPGAQLFIPEALLDLRERRPRPRAQQAEQFSPTAQLVIIGALLRRAPEGASATVLARRYGVAVMSVTRAFDELEAAGAAQAPREGRERRLQLAAAGRDLWERTEGRLQSPVRKTRTVIVPFPDRFPARLAGESALSHITALAPPRTQRLAVAAAAWAQLVRDHGLRETERGDPATEEVETWSYDPGALTDERVVDPLSLHLSLRNHPDERVASAADQLLEAFPWS